MTREEEIRQAAIEANIVSAFSMNGKPPPSPFFMIGAKWADEHPREGLVDIEKACEWLNKHAKKYYFNKEGHYLGTEELVEDFKLSMEV